MSLLEPSWSYPLHHAVGAYLVAGEDVLVGCRSTGLACLHALTGQVQWSAKILNPWGWLAATRRLVLYLNQHSLLLALCRRTGELLWSRELPGTNGWLHAFENRIVVGGWRQYTDVVALDASTGRLAWTHDGRTTPLHSTRIHAESESLVVADRSNGGVLRFLRLDDGREFLRLSAPGGWVRESSERPRGTSDESAPIVLESPPRSIVSIRGRDPEIEHIELGESVWSQNLELSGDRVAFLDEKRELFCWRPGQEKLEALGRVEHDRRDQVFFRSIPGFGYFFGSSAGFIHHWPHADSPRSSVRIGKRVATCLSLVGPLLVFGTDSGEVVGLRVNPGGEFDSRS